MWYSLHDKIFVPDDPKLLTIPDFKESTLDQTDTIGPLELITPIW